MIDASLQEQLRLQYNPDNSPLRTLQLQMLDILIEFDRICKKHNIRYWLDAGTLLGAIRHGGFIPWDDDIDVCMFPADYKKFCKVCQAELAPPYKWHAAKTKENYYSHWGRVVNEQIVVRRQLKNPDRIETYNIWLDVFIVEEGTVKTKRHIEKIYGKCLRRKNKQITDGKFNYYTALFLLVFIEFFLFLLRVWNKVAHRDEFVYVYGTPFCPKHYKRCTFPLSSVEFEGYSFSAPGDPHGYLTTFYGDYNAIPSEEKRVTHDFILS